jgi:hypothetical protein
MEIRNTNKQTDRLVGEDSYSLRKWTNISSKNLFFSANQEKLDMRRKFKQRIYSRNRLQPNPSNTEKGANVVSVAYSQRMCLNGGSCTAQEFVLNGTLHTDTECV